MSESSDLLSARVKLIEAPIASPGQCALCGKNSHPVGFAAPDNMDFEFYGTFYLCGDCVWDFARLFGYTSAEESAKLKERVRQAEDDAYILASSLQYLGDLDAAIRHYVASNTPAIVDDLKSLGVEDSLILKQEPVDEPGTIVEDSGTIAEPSSEFTELIGFERSDDVSELGSNASSVIDEFNL